MNFFEKYLTVWVALCMAVGVFIGKFFPAIPDFLGKFQYANVSILIAILIWMINPFTMFANEIRGGYHVQTKSRIYLCS